MGTMSDSLINHTLNKIQTLKEQVFALNFWSHFETNVPHVCQVRVREKEFMLERDAEETKKIAWVCVIFSALISLAIIYFHLRSSVQLSWLPMKQGDRQKGCSC